MIRQFVADDGGVGQLEEDFRHIAALFVAIVCIVNVLVQHIWKAGDAPGRWRGAHGRLLHVLAESVRTRTGRRFRKMDGAKQLRTRLDSYVGGLQEKALSASL